MESTVTAVESSNLYMAYSKGSSKVIALNNLSISIPSGCIYSLIGPSGCGKTTFLRALIGLVRVQSGSFCLYGYPLGHRNLSIPGHHLGYMPQDVALNEDLTIGEMINYFYRLYNIYSPLPSKGVTSAVCEDKGESKTRENVIRSELNDLVGYYLSHLSLPSSTTLISSLSGGQKRRVSFLCSIIHKPKLIILDEPTVGCDPLVITSMWSILRSLTSNERSTIIITTHYLEEARKTDIIGFMRKGQLLEQGTPIDVLNRLNVNSIENAFTFLCEQYNRNKNNKPYQQVTAKQQQVNQGEQNCVQQSQPTCKSVDSSKIFIELPTGNNNRRDKVLTEKETEYLSVPSTFWYRFVVSVTIYLQLTYVLTHRLCLRLIKLKILLSSSILVIPFLMLISKYSMGGTPIVSLGVVNYELDEPEGSLIFLDHIDKNLIHLISYNSTELAQHDSLNDQVTGYITISPRFTSKLVSQYTFTSDNVKTVHHRPPILYHGDNIRLIVVKTVMVILQSALDQSLPLIMNKSGFNPALGSPFAKIVDPIAEPVSSEDLYNSTIYWMPKFLIFWSFVTAMMLSSFTFHRDRTEPLFERSLSAGSTLGQFVIGHFITAMILPTINSLPILLITIYLLGVPCKGSLLLALLIYLLNAATGTVTALMLASINLEISFIYILSSAYVFSGMATTGLLWPQQALPYFLSMCPHFFPFADSFKSMIRVLSYGSTWNDSLIVWNMVKSFCYIVLVLIVVRVKLSF